MLGSASHLHWACAAAASSAVALAGHTTWVCCCCRLRRHAAMAARAPLHCSCQPHTGGGGAIPNAEPTAAGGAGVQQPPVATYDLARCLSSTRRSSRPLVSTSAPRGGVARAAGGSLPSPPATRAVPIAASAPALASASAAAGQRLPPAAGHRCGKRSAMYTHSVHPSSLFMT